MGRGRPAWGFYGDPPWLPAYRHRDLPPRKKYIKSRKQRTERDATAVTFRAAASPPRRWAGGRRPGSPGSGSARGRVPRGCGLSPTAGGQVGRGPTPRTGETFVCHRHLITSGAVSFVFRKLRINGRKGREEAGLKERKKRKHEEGRETGEERRTQVQSTLVDGWPSEWGRSPCPSTGLGRWGEWGEPR